MTPKTDLPTRSAARDWLCAAHDAGLLVIAHPEGLQFYLDADRPHAAAPVLREIRATPGLDRAVYEQLRRAVHQERKAA